MKTGIKIKRKTREQQEGIFLRTLKAVAGLIACTGVILILPLSISASWIRWPIFIIVSIIAVGLINLVINALLWKRNSEWGGCLLMILFVLILLLCENTSTYRKEKGYERNGVIVDAEIIDIYTVALRTREGYELEYAFSVDGKAYSRAEIISRDEWERLNIGMTIPVIYHSDHPKISRMEDYPPVHNLFLFFEKNFHKNVYTDKNENIK